MKNHLLSLSRNLFRTLHLVEALLSKTSVIQTELHEIKELLLQQSEQDQGLRLIPAWQAAASLKVHVNTLLKWAQQGKLKPIIVGRNHYYKASDVL